MKYTIMPMTAAR